MSAQACYPSYPGDPWPNYPAWPYGHPGYYGTSTVYLNGPTLTEDRIREIIREELAAALKALKEEK